MLAAGSAGKQQVGDVDAANEQHGDDRGKQHEKRVADRSSEISLQGDDICAEGDVIGRLTSDSLLQRVHFGCGLRDGDAGLEPRDAEVVVVAFNL